jgi:hypothetical protein
MIPEAKRAQIIEALKANPNARVVAEQVGGVSKVTVRKIAKQIGVDLAAAKAARCALPLEKRAKIIAALIANPNASAVARQVGVSHVTVRKIAKQTGIDLAAAKAARSALPPEKRAKIIAALKANPNANVVARQVGVCPSTVWKIAKQIGIDLAAANAARCALPLEKRAKIIAALKANPNASVVARQVGVSPSTVWTIAKRESIELTAGKAARARSKPAAQSSSRTRYNCGQSPPAFRRRGRGA